MTVEERYNREYEGLVEAYDEHNASGEKIKIKVVSNKLRKLQKRTSDGALKDRIVTQLQKINNEHPPSSFEPIQLQRAQMEIQFDNALERYGQYNVDKERRFMVHSVTQSLTELLDKAKRAGYDELIEKIELTIPEINEDYPFAAHEYYLHKLNGHVSRSSFDNVLIEDFKAFHKDDIPAEQGDPEKYKEKYDEIRDAYAHMEKSLQQQNRKFYEENLKNLKRVVFR